MNKEELQKIASTMTKSEFKENYFKEDCGGDIILVIDNETYACPGRIKLTNIMSRNDYGCCHNCETCWNNAIKELKFKGENKMEGLTLQQVFECEVGTKFKIIYNDGIEAEKLAVIYKNEFNIKLLKWVGEEERLVLSHDLFIAKYIPIVEEKEVSFMSAVIAFDEGGKVKSLYGDEQGTLSEYIYDGKEKIDFTDEDNQSPQAREILEAKWYITY